ncbi:aminoglycoside phosphotransferase family protein [Sphingomonas sp. BT-65]|uniref:phosphotransferase family protein n=1 Tax=Sphingomonas sp. BT-65 TaxID=2989821 RepID=UPI002235EDF6|nr:aminoglycoside phosphotransferase family protein [Sphingomonas sp. BT-65]MCW4462009.1 aminoglycoside phosphotransferase family protein [Sphingomonas sp. BT-65]
MDRGEQIGDVLRHVGIDARVAAVQPLTGGVSSDIFRVELDDRTVCVKFAIDQLRVASEWRAPVGRSAAEHAWLAFVASAFPGFVPSLLGVDDANHAIVMEFLPPADHPTWKARLLAGDIDVAFAGEVGARLAAIHSRSAIEPRMAERFDNADNFASLRLDPYLRFTAARHPDLASQLEALAAALATARIALVHGDISPKNILCGPKGPVFIDAECATFGDPAFDIAFCLNHLVIKSIVFPSVWLEASAEALWTAYRAGIDWEPAAAVQARVARILPALMLARVDGKSPLEYLTPESGDAVRRIARAVLRGEARVPGGLFIREALA